MAQWEHTVSGGDCGRHGARLPLLILCLHTGAGLQEPAFAWMLALPPLALAGMVSGRRTLWLMLLFLQCCVLAGALHDLFFAGHPVGIPGVMSAAIVVSSGLLTAAILFDVMAAMIGAGLDGIRVRDQQLVATERRIREEEERREKVVGHLIHGQKTKAMGQLAGGIVHDLNNILGIILGYAQWHQRRSRPEDLKKALIGVENAAHRGVAVSRKLLGFSRYDANHREVFDIGEALFSLRGTLRQLFDPRVSISVTPVDVGLPIRFDRDEFELAILNVASNARDAMPEGGRFEISVALDEASESGAWVRISLRDNGCGMSPAVQQRIFEPSFTTKRSSGGNGLGLAVVSMIVGESGGRVQVESSPGQGSRITLTLPLVQRTSLRGAAPRVLLVDNDTALRAALTAALEGKGCQVLCARESAEAERLVQRGEVPDVLVMDYHMPDINGPALIHRLRAEHGAGYQRLLCRSARADQ